MLTKAQKDRARKRSEWLGRRMAASKLFCSVYGKRDGSEKGKVYTYSLT